MKVKVNEEACIGCGICQATAGEVFEINEQGLSSVVAETVSEELVESVKDAIESCPTAAISEVSE